MIDVQPNVESSAFSRDGDSNRAPSIDIDPDEIGQVPKNETIRFRASARDTDGEVVGYSWTFERNGSFVEYGSGGPLYSTSFSQPGTYSVTVTVEDDDGATSSETGSFTVLPFDPDDSF